MFSEYISVTTEYQLACKVRNAVKEKISEEAYAMICRVALSNHIGKADLIYRFLILGFHMGKKVLDYLSNEVVSNVFKINRYVSFEAHHYFGFLRFSEHASGILTAVIHPKNNVITLITPHFCDRLPNERFIIYDKDRKIAALHLPQKSWILVESMMEEFHEFKDFTDKEDDYQELWRTFFQNIAIKERTNYKLQRNMLPIRFREDMTEFNG